jgi:hypothetical protein
MKPILAALAALVVLAFPLPASSASIDARPGKYAGKTSDGHSVHFTLVGTKVERFELAGKQLFDVAKLNGSDVFTARPGKDVITGHWGVEDHMRGRIELNGKPDVTYAASREGS